MFRILKAIANEKETEIIDQNGEDSETCDLDTPQVKERFLIEKPDFSFLDIQTCKEETLDPWEEQSFQEILNSGLDSQISSTEFDTENDPDKTWCFCQKTQNNCVMINCGTCSKWFHGSFVGISAKKEKEMKENGQVWTCPKCCEDNSAPFLKGQEISDFLFLVFNSSKKPIRFFPFFS